MAVAVAFVDFTTAAKGIVQMATQISRAFGMKLILMHVSTPDAEFEGGQFRSDESRRGVAAEMRRYRRDLAVLAEGCGKSGVETRAVLVRGRSVRGNPVPQMVREIKQLKPSLIIMGTHQHGRLFEAFFGSASSKLLRETKCPIVLVPAGRRLSSLSANKNTERAK